MTRDIRKEKRKPRNQKAKPDRPFSEAIYAPMSESSALITSPTNMKYKSMISQSDCRLISL